MIRFLIVFVAFVSFGCLETDRKEALVDFDVSEEDSRHRILSEDTMQPIKEVFVNQDVAIRDYFKWMDSLTSSYNQQKNYSTNEYHIVHSNPWIIDTLAHTDYYYLMEKGIFNEDSQALIVLKKGQKLIIPDSVGVRKLNTQFERTYLDLNIPEFKLRIIQNGQNIHTFPVRVGQNGKRYLAMAKGVVDMRTKPGVGKIIRVNKAPLFINPKDNHKYKSTRRDDGKVTKLPAIPWLEPALNGRSYGQLIHPTTNMATLGKAYSNGCIGLRESDAWIVYYYAPIGTKVVFRYDLQRKNETGALLEFENIYPGFEDKGMQKEAIAAALQAIDGKAIPVCDCLKIEQR